MDYEKRERDGVWRDTDPRVDGDTLKMVPQVTRQHGERFAEECAKLTNDDVTPCDVFAETRIFEWPNDPDLQSRYHGLKREIVTRALASARDALADAFVAVANDVIERERNRA